MRRLSPWSFGPWVSCPGLPCVWPRKAGPPPAKGCFYPTPPALNSTFPFPFALPLVHQHPPISLSNRKLFPPSLRGGLRTFPAGSIVITRPVFPLFVRTLVSTSGLHCAAFWRLLRDPLSLLYSSPFSSLQISTAIGAMKDPPWHSHFSRRV